MKDSTNEFINEDRARISQEAANLLELMQNTSPNDFVCGINKGLEKQRKVFDTQRQGFSSPENIEISAITNHVDKSDAIVSVSHALEMFITAKVNSPKYTLKKTGWSEITPKKSLTLISIKPAVAAFFHSRIGPGDGVELFALNITVEVTHSDSKTTIEIASHFNPDTFRNVKIEYLGEFCTGTNRHFYKDFFITDTNALKDVKPIIFEKLNEVVDFYFK
jgi:hypothetical protein